MAYNERRTSSGRVSSGSARATLDVGTDSPGFQPQAAARQQEVYDHTSF